MAAVSIRWEAPDPFRAGASMGNSVSAQNGFPAAKQWNAPRATTSLPVMSREVHPVVGPETATWMPGLCLEDVPHAHWAAVTTTCSSHIWRCRVSPEHLICSVTTPQECDHAQEGVWYLYWAFALDLADQPGQPPFPIVFKPHVTLSYCSAVSSCRQMFRAKHKCAGLLTRREVTFTIDGESREGANYLKLPEGCELSALLELMAETLQTECLTWRGPSVNHISFNVA